MVGFMQVRGFLTAIAAIGLVMTAGCEEFATGVAGLADELDLADGAYWPDEHHTDSSDGPCPSYFEYGRVDNQTYWRARNQGDSTTSYVLTWSTGLTTRLTLEPGETSDYVYMTPSVVPDELNYEC